jgi:hypothetical protein
VLHGLGDVRADEQQRRLVGGHTVANQRQHELQRFAVEWCRNSSCRKPR